jgi:hypothetical protein
MNAISQALLPLESSRISLCETTQKACEILETTYEITKLKKSNITI